VAWTLWALGNSVETVAGFVGHRNPRVTQDVYIAMSRAQQRQLVNCPWLPRAMGESVVQQGRAMAEAICSPFGSRDGRTFPTLEFQTGLSVPAAPHAHAHAPKRPPPPKKKASRAALVALVHQYLQQDGVTTSATPVVAASEASSGT
jgi:hypothetical protein